MSDPRIESLAESARNRGLKLVRSRVRSPGKRRFGKVGLTDKAGKPVFGMDDKGPAAKPEQVEEYLRGSASNDWGASLGAEPTMRSKPKPKRAAKAAPAPRPKPKSEPAPKLVLRDAKPGDAPALAALIGLLGAEVDAKGVRTRLTALSKARIAPIVATLGREVVGLCGLHQMTAIHRERPVGRINLLVVGEAERGRGIGRILVEEAERRFQASDCELIEITSNDRLTAAHAFYRHLGYERTSIRFAKKLA